jgi:hypothetical protein
MKPVQQWALDRMHTGFMASLTTRQRKSVSVPGISSYRLSMQLC